MTGANTFLNTLLLKKLSVHPGIREVHIFDFRPPVVRSPKFIFHRVDLTKDKSSFEIAEILIRNKIKTFLHSALFSGPTRNHSNHHEVESIGTFHILNAIAEAQIKKLIVSSHTFVYGARPKNPNFLSESFPIKSQGPYFVRTRADVENQIFEFANTYTDCKVTTLRFAAILGPNSTNIRAKYFLSGVVPIILGYDLLLQFIHEEDALQALMLALYSDKFGIFNIVGKGLISLTTGIHLSGKIPVPAPSFVCKSIFRAGYVTRLWELDACMIPFFQYLCVASSEKAQRELHFKPFFSSRQALKSMLETTRLRSEGFSSPMSTLGEEQEITQKSSGFLKLN